MLPRPRRAPDIKPAVSRSAVFPFGKSTPIGQGPRFISQSQNTRPHILTGDTPTKGAITRTGMYKNLLNYTFTMIIHVLLSEQVHIKI